ncbi:MAG: alpha/beta hydrolase [Gammaproteobacteria bacterium]|nr:alpha/beta hydrolase [Gammaproteobacteria bacterium]
MPVPAVFASGAHSPFPAHPAVEKSTRVQVFYATNRLPVGPRGARVHTILPGQTLYAGTARVRIGSQETTWETLYEQSTTGRGPRPGIKLESLDELASFREGEPADSLDADARRFFDAVNQALAGSRNKDLTIYVHGSNSTVELATAQAAQFRHFSGRSEVVLVFVWPSAGSGLRYFTDVRNARQSVPVFNRLCELLGRHTRAEHLNLLAYSAGAQIVSPGLAAAGRQRRSGTDVLARLGEVYLAAPDIAFPSFVAQLPLYIDRARRVTVSANLNDAALGLSRWLHGVSRLGNPDPAELSEPASRWLIDAATHLKFDLIAVKPEVIPGLRRRSHAFWYEHPWVSSDVVMKFLFHIPPEARGLVRNRTAAGFPYWTFPPDYDGRVVDLKRRLRSERTLAAPARNGGEADKRDPTPR